MTSHWSQSPPRQVGFSLIELMIVVVVIGLLAAVAFPSFMGSIKKGRRSEAFTALSNVLQAQERWRSNQASYSSDLTSAPPTGLGVTGTTPSGYYNLSLANVTATGYEAIATAVTGSSQVSDGTCGKIAVKMLGGNLTYASSTVGGTLTFANTDRCWSR